MVKAVLNYKVRIERMGNKGLVKRIFEWNLSESLWEKIYWGHARKLKIQKTVFVSIMSDDYLTTTLQCLMQDNARVEDDTVLIKLYSKIDSMFKSFEPKNALSWSHRTYLWDFMAWGCSRLHGQCCSSVAALALKCVATCVHTEAGFDALRDSEILDGILSVMQLSSQQPSTRCNNGSSLHNGVQVNGSTVINSQNECAGKGVLPNSRNLSSWNDLSEMNSSILHALLSVILALLEHKPGREWVQHHEVGIKVLLPCLSYSSVFVQRAAASALAQILHSSQQQCELLFPSIREASEGPSSSLKPSVLISFMSRLLDDMSQGQCPVWLSAKLVSLHQTLRKHMTSLSASTSQLRSLFELRLRLLLQQHSYQVLGGGAEEETAEGEVALIFRVLPDLIITDGHLVSSSGWARAATLVGCWWDALATADRDTPSCMAVARLVLHLLMLPVGVAVRADVAEWRDTVMAHLRQGAPAGQYETSLSALQVWLVERAEGCSDAGAARACLLSATAAVPSLTTQLCVELIKLSGWRTLFSLDRSCDPPTPLADEPTVLATVLLLQALIRKDVALIPMLEAMPVLSDVFSSPHNTKQRAVAVLECLMLYLRPSAVLLYGLPQANIVKLMVEESLCHTAWEVRDSALQVLTTALQYEEYHPVVYSECVRRSTEALLDCQDSFVQSAAATLLAAAHARCLPGWDWSAAHAWCVRVCCSADAVAGCECDAVTAAAWVLLLSLHSRQRCVYSSSEEQSSTCILAALRHAQHCCAADSDILRLAALQYVAGHIESVLQISEPSGNNASSVSIVRCCADGSAWCIMRCAHDLAAPVREKAVLLRGLFQDAHCIHTIAPDTSSDLQPPAKRARSQQSKNSEMTNYDPNQLGTFVESAQITSASVAGPLAGAQLEVKFSGIIENENFDIVLKSISNSQNIESINEISHPLKRDLNQDSLAKHLETDADRSGTIDHIEAMEARLSDEMRSTVVGTGELVSKPNDAYKQASSIQVEQENDFNSKAVALAQNCSNSELESPQLDHSKDILLSCKRDSMKRAASNFKQKFTVSSSCTSNSNEAEVILEEVLDFPDLRTLDDLRRCPDSTTSHLLADRNQTPAVSLESFTSFLNGNLSETDSYSVREKREFRELLEDIQLQVQRQKEESLEDHSLVFGEPSHLTIDCY
ncbi:Armadillo-type fold [Trinorchestia longiramus]|nr:Armadillo-type fold [Trinorchestia longiramus]